MDETKTNKNKNKDKNENGSNFFLDNKDILFQIKDKIDLTKISEFVDSSYLSSLFIELETLGEICSSVSTTSLDENFSEVLDLAAKLKKMKLFSYERNSLCPGRSYSKNQVPFLFRCISAELLSRASPTLFMQMYSYSLGAYIISRYASDELYQKISSDFESSSASLSFTEESGSDLSDIKTFAKKSLDEEGIYLLTGNKTLILNADSRYSIVLATTKKEGGSVSDLRLFLLDSLGQPSPECIKIEELSSRISYKSLKQYKMSFSEARAWPLVLDKSSYLVIRDLLNQSKLVDAFCALGMLEGAKNLACSRTQTRLSWKRQLFRHESVIEKLLDLSVASSSFRSFCYDLASTYSYLVLAKSKTSSSDFLVQKSSDEILLKIKSTSQKLKERLPCLKWWASTEIPSCISEAASLFGGHGLLKSQAIQVYLRDSFAIGFQYSPLHVQAILTTKTILKKFSRNPSEFFSAGFFKMFKFGYSKPQKILLKFKQVFKRTIRSLVSSIAVTNIRYRLSFLDYINLSELVSFIRKNLIHFSDTRGILVCSEKLTTMQSIVFISECLIKDYGIWENHDRKIRRYLESKFSFKFKSKKNELKDSLEDLDSNSLTGGSSLVDKSKKELKDSIDKLSIGSKLDMGGIYSRYLDQNLSTVNISKNLSVRKQDIIDRFLFKYGKVFYSLAGMISSKDTVITHVLRSSYYEEDEGLLSEWKGF